ncbi:hypothetical protein AQPE_0593 [Aquipluma nitroreducens]|uniref:Uncharacterized protein n=1 Tax=Aquipluma nitroreducens TaxID=2010828 RepID=A0A5K7S4Q0_9BACT|nr:hypothetical protein AQPE_0593 [Aquipluma nitroreducens]
MRGNIEDYRRVYRLSNGTESIWNSLSSGFKASSENPTELQK